jgi:hypothetical protein
MKNRRDYADAYAETLVLPQKEASVQATSSDRDPLALYEEYARELTNEAVAPPHEPRKR